MYLRAKREQILNRIIRIGTRGSHLARWQAGFVQQQLAALGVQSELVIIKTKGDQIQHLGFDKIEGKGFFTKEIEDALLHGDVDMAVHSMKDMPTTQPEGLVLAGVSYREDPADWLLLRMSAQDATQTLRLPIGATVGTSSARRKAQLLDFRKDLIIKDIRGNVPTRLDKLRQGEFDAIVLAAAGLKRLQLDVSDLYVTPFSPRELVPAPAQGVLVFQTTKDDLEMRRLLRQIHHPEVSAVTNVERKVLQLMAGGCHMPLGVYCERDALGNYHVWAAVADSWDMPLRRARLSSSTSFNLAEQLVKALQKSKKM